MLNWFFMGAGDILLLAGGEQDTRGESGSKFPVSGNRLRKWGGV